MKKVALSLILAGLAFSPVIHANEEVPPAAPVPAATEKSTEAKAPSHRAARKDARKECLKENADLKGKDLHNCIKGKLGK